MTDILSNKLPSPPTCNEQGDSENFESFVKLKTEAQ